MEHLLHARDSVRDDPNKPLPAVRHGLGAICPLLQKEKLGLER